MGKTAAIPSAEKTSQHEDSRRQAYGRRAEFWLSAALVVVAALVLLSVVLLAVVHLNDRYLVDHVSGARMALAKRFNAGILYPELFDGSVYGGTRWMPVTIILHGLLSRVTGDYLVSGKLLGYVGMGGLLLAMLWVMRRLRTPLPLALGLMGIVLVTRTGLSAAMDLRFDVLPLLLQLVAVEIVARTRRPGALVGAAALSALAFMSKASALWAPLVIVVWLVKRDRRSVAWFSAAYLGFVGAALLAFFMVTDGRILENVFGLGSAGITGAGSLVVAPYRLMSLLLTHATPAWALTPLVGYAFWLAVMERRASIYLVSLPFALVLVLLVLADIGTGWNQLLDVIVLVALVVGEVGGRASSGECPNRGSPRAIRIILALTVLWLSTSGAVTLSPDVKQALSRPDSYGRDPLAGLATARTRMLSEDPYVPVSLGQIPVVLDPFMIPRIGQQYPDALSSLVDRIEGKEFDLVLLVVRLEPLGQRWWSEYHFGPRVVRAIAGSYVSAGRRDGYYIYVPRGGEAG